MESCYVCKSLLAPEEAFTLAGGQLRFCRLCIPRPACDTASRYGGVKPIERIVDGKVFTGPIWAYVDDGSIQLGSVYERPVVEEGAPEANGGNVLAVSTQDATAVDKQQEGDSMQDLHSKV
jgi:hypothetical protein